VIQILDQEYSRMTIDGLGEVSVFNDKHIQQGSPVHLSVRPEKFQLGRERPEGDSPKLNCFEGVVEDIVYLGSHTRYWIKVGDYRVAVMKQHARFFLDEKPVEWKDRIWLWWHADDGFMLEQYHEADEELLSVPDTES
jgi:spermidine/putrescine transport system ATP-binding protein